MTTIPNREWFLKEDPSKILRAWQERREQMKAARDKFRFECADWLNSGPGFNALETLLFAMSVLKVHDKQNLRPRMFK